MNEISKNQQAWLRIFNDYNVLEAIENKGFFVINSNTINKYREARLMTKFDSAINLPDVFKDNDLSILPTSRGGYIISHFKAYKEFESLNEDIIHIDFPEYIESIDANNITSESIAINCAFISGILSDFIEDDSIVPTVNGRMSSSIFDFSITNLKDKSKIKVDVVNSQVEIDGGFEGAHSLMLLEAKNTLSDDFLVRQLYYPFRLWSSSITKPVKPVFMTYSNSVFSLYEYAFKDPNDYNSLELIKHKNYSFETTSISIDDILTILKNVVIIDEPELPFPQADKFKRVINLCEILSDSDLSLDEITLQYAFDERQSRYYTDAGRYLGLLEKYKSNGKVTYKLSDLAKGLLKMKYKERQLKFVELMVSHNVFHETLRLTLEQSQLIGKNEIIDVMKDSSLYRVKEESTYTRRASTVIGWINWILDLIEI